jgi:hypothetical protein
MPLQNRVTPCGELISTESRGTLMGNRGCLHDGQRRIRRAFAGKRWIICVLEFRGRHRLVMSPGQYTELFFLDEATALAAGHRPCAECQRERYNLFRETWAAVNPGIPGGSVDDIDRVLHAERLDVERKKRTWLSAISALPPGVMVVDQDDAPYVVGESRLLPWGPGGYGRGVPKRGGTFRVLTPESVVRAIACGFPVIIHPSAGG